MLIATPTPTTTPTPTPTTTPTTTPTPTNADDARASRSSLLRHEALDAP